LASDSGGIVEGRRRGIHRRYVQIQRQRFPLPIKNGAAVGIKGDSLFMLTASFLHHRFCLQHLKIEKTKEQNGESNQKTQADEGPSSDSFPG
jgi:hypothetical protein